MKSRRELLTIIAVVVVLIPALYVYLNFSSRESMRRAEVSEAVALLNHVREPIIEYFNSSKKWPESVEQIMGSGGGGIYVRSVVISKGAGGTGEIELNATMWGENILKLDPQVAGKSVQLSSSDNGKSWVCRSADVPPEYLPASCQGSVATEKKGVVRE